MIIQSVQIENFRSFYGTQIIEFSAENKKNTTFIWANNNVGKTNLLNAITWCLHNLFTSSFKKSEDLLNHQAKDNGRNNYSVVIIFRESDKTFSVKRSGGSFSGFHVHEIMPDGDFKEVSSPALFINSILPKEMMRYFIIDGEGISESVDSKGQISAERSIKDILGFQVAEKTLEDLKNIRQSHNKELGRLDVGSDLTKKQNEFDAIDDSVSNKIKELAGLEESLKEYQDQFESSDLYLKESNHEVVKLKTRQRDDLHVQIRESENELKSLENAKVNLIRKYSWVAFSDKLSEEAMDFIDESQFKGTIPAPFNESLVKDILDESRCICGAEITPGTAAFQKINEMLGKAANPDILNRIARARSQLQVIKSYSSGAIEDIRDNYERITVLSDKLISLKDRIDEISIEISGVDNSKISDYEKIRKSCLEKIGVTQRQIGSKKSEIEGLQGRKISLDGEIKRLSSLTPQASMLRYRIEFISDIEKIIEFELKDAFEKIKIQLVTQMNEFMHKYLIQNLAIKITSDYKIGLYDSENRLTAPGGGLTAMLSLVFISTLISIARMRKNASGNILTPGAIAPIILDAPFSKLSETYAPKLAAALPSNSDQLVIFMYEGNAKGGDEIIRKNGVLGKEYYLKQKISGPKDNKPSSYLKLNGKKYLLNEYNCSNNSVDVIEVSSND